MKVERATEATPDLAAALERLLPQLSPDRTPATDNELAELLASPGSALLVARSEQDEIVGTLTLALFRTQRACVPGSTTWSWVNPSRGRGRISRAADDTARRPP